MRLSVSPAFTVYVLPGGDAGAGLAAGGGAGAGPPVTRISAATSACQVGMVLIAAQISFFSASVATVPFMRNLPSLSSMVPWNFPSATFCAHAYLPFKLTTHPQSGLRRPEILSAT